MFYKLAGRKEMFQLNQGKHFITHPLEDALFQALRVLYPPSIVHVEGEVFAVERGFTFQGDPGNQFYRWVDHGKAIFICTGINIRTFRISTTSICPLTGNVNIL